MRDVSRKFTTLRTATAEARILVQGPDVESLIERGVVEKGNIYEASRIAAILAAKNCPSFLPFCHPVRIDHVEITYNKRGNLIVIRSSIRAVDRTGVEMEALVAAAVCALNIYDMLKPSGHEVTIEGITLIEKHGGKSDYVEQEKKSTGVFTSSVVVISDSTSSGKREDRSGKILLEALNELGFKRVEYHVVSDDKEKIREKIQELLSSKIDLIVTSGGTGVGPRDNTRAVIEPMIDRPLDGIIQAYREFSLLRNPRAALSLGLCGTIGDSLILSIPGSSGAAKDAKDSILFLCVHALRMLRGEGHDEK